MIRMNKKKHTRPPWEVKVASEDEYSYVAKLADYLIVPQPGVELGDVKKDLALIKTAPEMLKRLEQALGLVDRIIGNNGEYVDELPLVDDIEKTIKKAKGDNNDAT